jgi:Tfp pilus assembly protein PilF
MRGDYAAAKEQFERALQVNPQNTVARKNLDAVLRKTPGAAR